MRRKHVAVVVMAVLAAAALAPAALAQDYPEPPPGGLAVNVGDATVAEGHAGTTSARFQVTLTSASSEPITIAYETPAEGNATPGVDFAAGSGSVTIPAGQTAATITVGVVGDTVPEPNELFYVHLASATGGATIVKHHGAGTILDDDGGGGTIADTKPPNTMIHGGPARVTRARRASFHLMSSEPYSKFQCRLDAGPWRACGASKTYRRLKKGVHTFRARAIDQAGNVDPTPAKKTWRIR